jgi:hypothetical protein
MLPYPTVCLVRRTDGRAPASRRLGRRNIEPRTSNSPRRRHLFQSKVRLDLSVTSNPQKPLQNPITQRVGNPTSLSSGASKQLPSRNRNIPNFSGYKAASFTRNPDNFTEITDPKQGHFGCQYGGKGAVLATFSVQIARFSRESRFFARKSG